MSHEDSKGIFLLKHLKPLKTNESCPSKQPFMQGAIEEHPEPEGNPAGAQIPGQSWKDTCCFLAFHLCKQTTSLLLMVFNSPKRNSGWNKTIEAITSLSMGILL